MTATTPTTAATHPAPVLTDTPAPEVPAAPTPSELKPSPVVTAVVLTDEEGFEEAAAAVWEYSENGLSVVVAEAEQVEEVEERMEVRLV